MDIKNFTSELIKQIISNETMIDLSQIKENVAFDEYGIDSIMSVSIIRVLENTFGELSKSLLFEFPTITELVEYISDEYESILIEKMQKQNTPIHDEPHSELLDDFRTKEDPTSQLNDITHKSHIISKPESSTTYLNSNMKIIPPVFDTSIIETKSRSEQVKPIEETIIDSHTIAPHPDSNYSKNDVAIIGIAGRFPQADDIETFWQNLVNAKDCITTVPERLWKWQDYWDEKKGMAGRSYLKWGGFLSDHRTFDPLFFGISKLEAESLDPQERLFLETVYHTFEDAGYNQKKLTNYRVGLYVSVMWGLYHLYGAMDASTGSSYASIANRASYFFNLKGPSIPLDTMCSGSMTTVHLACESIRSGEIDMAIAGGVNLTTHPNKYFVLSKTGFASSHGRCKSFSADGDGYVPSEGVGAVLLKSMSKAIKDKDHIYGVIKATSINHGGKVNGFTVPSAKSQAELVTSALERFSIDPSTISYVEAHAPGTALGDPIEIRGMTMAFDKYTNNKQFCSIGSVKSNIGHLESAASFASIAKVIKQLEEKTLVPSIHLENENKNIQFDKTPFFLQKDLCPWKQQLINDNGHLKALPRRAAINSFGAGGANAHMIIEEYISPTIETCMSNEYIFPISARDDISLNNLINSYVNFVEELLSIRKKIEESPIVEKIMNALNEATSISPSLLSNNDLLTDLLTMKESTSDLIVALSKHCNIFVTEREISQCKTVFDLKNIVIAKKYKKYIAEGNAEHIYLSSIAYTMQTGREHLSCRVAITANSLSEFLSVLIDTLSGKQNTKIFRGDLKTNPAMTPHVGEKDKTFIKQLIEKKNHIRIAELWCKGVDIDWDMFYGIDKPTIVSLPLYPFAKIICWAPTAVLPNIKNIDSPPIIGAEKSIPNVDPIRNEEHNLYFLSSPGLKKSFLLGRLIQNSYEHLTKGSFHINDISLPSEMIDLSSINIDSLQESSAMKISLFCSDNEAPIASGYLIASDLIKSEFVSNNAHFLLQKSIVINSNKKVDLLGLEGISMTPNIIVARYIEIPKVSAPIIAISILHQLLAEFIGVSDEDINHIFNHDILLLDLISGDGWIVLNRRENGSVDAIIFNNKKQPSLYYSRTTNNIFLGKNTNYRLFSPKFEVVNIMNKESIDRKNTECMVVLPKKEDLNIEKLVKACHFKKVYTVFYDVNCKAEKIDATHWAINISQLNYIEQILKKNKNINQIMLFGGSFCQNDMNIDPVQEVTFFHKLMKCLLNTKENHDNKFTIHVLTRFCEVVKDIDHISTLAGGLSGYLRSFAREYPKINTKLTDVDWLSSVPVNSLAILSGQLNSSDKMEYFIRNNKLLTRQIVEYIPEPKNYNQTVFKKNGIYLLIGGGGTIGYQLSKYLALSQQAKIVWINRSPLNESRKEKLAVINQLGGECHYYSLDIQDITKLTETVEDIEYKFGKINGVFHLAMDKEICRINNLSDSKLNQAISSKITGTENLSTVFKNRAPDFIILFSSAEAYVGSIGWSSYTSGCSYQNQISQSISQRGITTYSINWGFWEGIDDNTSKVLKNKGIGFINIYEGIGIIEYVISNKCHQLIALKAEDNVINQMEFKKIVKNETAILLSDKFERGVASQIEQHSVINAIQTTSLIKENLITSSDLSIENLQTKLVSLFSQVLKIDESEIRANDDMLTFGVDSLILLNIHKSLEDQVGKISINVLLENHTISDVAISMFNEYSEQAIQFLNNAASLEIKPANKTFSNIEETLGQEELSFKEKPKVNEFNKPEKLEILRTMNLSEGEKFLKEYHQYYIHKTLIPSLQQNSINKFDLINGIMHGLVDTGHGKMEVIISGHGIPVILMPAVALTAPTWLYLLNSSLRKKYQFIVINPPGYGLSEALYDCNTQGIASAVMRTIDALEIKRPFHLVGSCLGCIASMYISKEYPEKVSSLTLIGAFYDTSDLNIADPNNLSGDQFELLANSSAELLREDFNSVINSFSEQDKWQAGIIKERCELLLNSQCVNLLVALRYLHEMINVSILPWLPEITIPTHCIYGDVDRIISPHHSKEISDGVKGSQLSLISGAAHFPYLTHEKLFIPIFEKFIDEHE